MLTRRHIERRGSVAFGAIARIQRIGRQARPAGERFETLLRRQIFPHHLDGLGRRHFPGLVSAHAVGQQDQRRLSQIVLPGFAGV